MRDVGMYEEYTNEEPARFQAACRNGFFRRGTALSKLGTDTGVGAARGKATCGWAVCANGKHGEAKDDAIRLCLALAAAARRQTQRRKPMALQWPRGRAPGLLTEPALDPPVCPPAHPTHRKNPRRNGDHTAFSIFPAAPPQNIAKRAQLWHMTPSRQSIRALPLCWQCCYQAAPRVRKVLRQMLHHER